MLSKLLKYEFKSTARIFLPIYPALLLLAALTKLSFAVFESANIMDIPRSLLSLMYVFMIIGIFVLTLVVALQRFYKNLLSGEGYLMFTLPVKASSHILSKLIVSFTWQVASMIVAFLSVLIVIPDYGFMKNLPSQLAEFSAAFKEYTNLSLGTVFALLVVLMIIAILYAYMTFFTAMSIGNLSNRNKILCSFGAYIGINMLVQTITMVAFTIIGNIPKFDFMSTPERSFMIDGSIIVAILLICCAIYLCLGVGAFFVSKYILKNKLNLQ